MDSKGTDHKQRYRLLLQQIQAAHQAHQRVRAKVKYQTLRHWALFPHHWKLHHQEWVRHFKDAPVEITLTLWMRMCILLRPKVAPVEMHWEANSPAYEAAEPHAVVRDEATQQLFGMLPIEEFGSGNPQAIDAMLDFLEVDVPAFRCGYFKEWCYRRLKGLPLTPEQEQRLRQLAVDLSQARGYRREIIELTRLMIKLADKPLMVRLHQLVTMRNKHIQKRARRMLTIIEHNRIDLRAS
jgi:hypothetical protein